MIYVLKKDKFNLSKLKSLYLIITFLFLIMILIDYIAWFGKRDKAFGYLCFYNMDKIKKEKKVLKECTAYRIFFPPKIIYVEPTNEEKNLVLRKR